MIRHIISDLTDRIEECEDGGEAVIAYKKYQPDWVLMDVSLKEIDGLTATRAIKTLYPLARIIIVTNHNDEQTRQAAMAVGAYAFLGKDNLLSLRSIINDKKI